MTAPSDPIFRFAPSPNGFLHLGHAYSALFTAHWAKQMGGKFLLRIEDTDHTRCRPEFVDAIINDLTWLGLEWEPQVRVQSEHFPLYAKAADRLKHYGLLYPCFCSRSEIAAVATGKDPDGAPLYPGTCRNLTPQEIIQKQKSAARVNWRIRMPEAVDKVGILTYSIAQPTPKDRPQIRYARPSRWGDVVLQRLKTPTSYHLSVVVDDAAQGVTHITRGKDMEAATDIHVLLQMLLGLPQPIYTHHRLITGDDDVKLAKSKNAPSLQSLRAAGATATTIRARLGF